MPDRRRLPTLVEFAVALAVLAVLARAVYHLAHWRDGWEGIREMTALEWLGATTLILAWIVFQRWLNRASEKR